MAPGSDYAAAPTAGKLKLKGVKDSGIDKKVTKKKKKKAKTQVGNDADFKDKSVVLKSLEDEDAGITKEKRREISFVDGQEVAPGSGVEDEELGERLKTEAEKRYEEQRRKRVSRCSALNHAWEGILTACPNTAR